MFLEALNVASPDEVPGFAGARETISVELGFTLCDIRKIAVGGGSMNTALWVVQGFLAFLFLGAGVQKLTQSREAMAETSFGGYATDYSASFLRNLGILELLGAIGVILPELTGILPWLTPLAALGLAVIMVGAVYTRVRRGETQMAVGTGIFFLLAAFVAYGRFFLDV